MWKVAKGVLSIIFGSAVFLIVFFSISYVLSLLAAIPFLGSILYYPSDAGWVKIVLPPISSVFAGAYIGKMTCGSAKPFSVFAIIIYSFNIIYLFLYGAITFTVVATTVVVFITSLICFSEK